MSNRRQKNTPCSTSNAIDDPNESKPDRPPRIPQQDARLQRIEAEVAQRGWRELKVLTTAGMDRGAILHLLSHVAIQEGNKGWTDVMRRQQKKLKSMARRMEILASDAEKCASDPSFVVQTWHYLVQPGGILGMKGPKSLKDADVGVAFILSGMRTLAGIWGKEATKFGWFLNKFGDRRTNLGEALLLFLVCLFLRKLKPSYLPELAVLLADAYEAAGKREKARKVSAESLLKQWKRHGRYMLGKWIELHTKIPPKQNPTMPAVSLPGLPPKSDQASF